jgi:KUP system potassium uptake protein
MAAPAESRQIECGATASDPSQPIGNPMTTALPGAVATASPRSRGIAALSLGALGVVYGDIGTSPLYTIRESFAGAHPLPIDRVHVLGVLSLIFWSIVLVVCVKYLTVVMRADNKGEGGTLALLALVERAVAGRRRSAAAIAVVGIAGAALFYGDGMLTPAISVLSAVEGLKVASPAFEYLVVPVTIAIVIALFAIQRRGTGFIGGLFGPVILVWFAALAALGIKSILAVPDVLWALSPHYALSFFLHDGWLAFLALGSVFLAVTGAETLYADLGHFGRWPIRIAWYAVAMPALVLNYLGQGALLIADPSSIDNPFYRLSPEWALMPMVVLATLATIIASQAAITGAFSMTQQAIHLGYLPRMRLIHTSGSARGQIYVPFVNWALLVFVVALVLGFQSSSNLAAAYGVALSSLMVLSTIQIAVVMLALWRWRRLAYVLGGMFLLVDLAFFIANATKIPDGGWFPLVAAAAIFVLLTSWQKGRHLLTGRLQAGAMTVDELIRSLSATAVRVPGTAIFLTTQPDVVPAALLHNLKHNKVIHETNLLLTVVVEDVPRVRAADRIESEDLGGGFRRVVLRYGFTDAIDVPRALARDGSAALGFAFDPMTVSYFLSRQTLVAAARSRMSWLRRGLFFWMYRSAATSMDYFRLPTNRVVELGSQVQI